MKKRFKNIFDKERRDLLKIFSAAGISKGLLRASPLVSGMMISRLADAQQTGPNKSVVVYTPDGCIPSQWFPNSNLTSFPPMSEPYSAVANECNFLRNMGHHRGGHGVMPTLLNNQWTGDSFDVNMGRTIGENRPFMYLNLGVHSNGHGYITRDNNTEVPFEDNPFNAFNRLFGNGGTGGGGGGTTPTDNTGSVIDAHKDAINALTNKLGNHERQRLDSHLSAIEETERRIQALADQNSNPDSGTSTCSVPAAPGSFALDFANFERHANLQADIIALALKCNLTSSASLGLGNHQGEFSFPYLNFTGIYHQSIHGGNGGDSSYPHFTETRRHISEMTVYLIQKLKTEGVLDSTIVMNVTEMGDGDAHSSNDIPLVMSGGGGAIRRGVSNAGGSSYTPLHMLHTAAVALGADQHPSYQGYASSVIPNVLA